MQKSYFITATGTGIGKTLVTCALCYQLRETGQNVHALKPVISGYGDPEWAPWDTQEILNSLGLSETEENINNVSLYRFYPALSPDMAAHKEGEQIDFDRLVEYCQSFTSYDTLLIEGIGGAMVPLTDTKTTLDLINALNIPSIVVVGGYLGTLSHTLTTLEALHTRNIPIASVIVSESEGGTVPLQDTISSLQNFISAPIIALPHILESDTGLWQYAPDLRGAL